MEENNIEQVVENEIKPNGKKRKIASPKAVLILGIVGFVIGLALLAYTLFLEFDLKRAMAEDPAAAIGAILIIPIVLFMNGAGIIVEIVFTCVNSGAIGFFKKRDGKVDVKAWIGLGLAIAALVMLAFSFATPWIIIPQSN